MPFFRVFAVTLVLLFSFNSHALSAHTTNVIHGNAPYVILGDGFNPLTDLRQIIGLNFPDGQGGYNWISAWDAGVAIKAPPGMHFNQVMSHSVVSDGYAHNIPYLTVGDADGDEAGGYVSGYLKATWYENGEQIPNDRLGNELWGCGGPYKLRVEVWNIQANTPYGAPNNRYYGNSWVEYTVIPHNPSICYLRPNDMGNYGGYDGNVFHNFWGFSRWSGFPTTGFQNAAFTAIGPGANQLYYRCYSHNGAGKIWLSTINGYGANCTVNYASQEKWQFIENGTPVITMEYFNGRDWIWMDSFTIPVPSKWPSMSRSRVIFSSGSTPFQQFTARTEFPVLSFCTGRPSGFCHGLTCDRDPLTVKEVIDEGFRREYLYSSNEIRISNSNNSWDFIRSVGNFMGEWGILKNYNMMWGENGIWVADQISHSSFGLSPTYISSEGRLLPSVYHENLKELDVICR